MQFAHILYTYRYKHMLYITVSVTCAFSAQNNSFIYSNASPYTVKLAKGTPLYPLIPAALILAGMALCKSAPYPIVISTLTLILALSYLLFFRDPERKACGAAVCSPADGVIRFVRKNGDGWLIAVFMNIHNVHVNRSPVDGTISEMRYIPGSHIPAFKKESDRNERVVYRIETPYGEIKMVQIAGIVARRIVPYMKEGDKLSRGERIGLIRFGSRVDTYLPKGFRPLVKDGERVKAGESPLAEPVEDEGGKE